MDEACVRLKYGRGTVELRLPRERSSGVWSLAVPAHAREANAGRSVRRRGLEELAAAGLEARTRGRHVGLLLADGTREWEPRAALEPLWPLLAGAREVTALLCTGTHDPGSAVNRRLCGEVRECLRAAGRDVELVVHDARRMPLVRLGTTRRGTPVDVNGRTEACEAFLSVAEMKPHYFAGYSHAVKLLVPGLASLETVRANHSWTLEDGARVGHHPWHPDPERRANPLAEDLVEAHGLVLGERPHLTLATIHDGDLCLWAGGGEARETTGRGIEAVDRLLGADVPPVSFLVVSAGGAPHDETLYTAQRALELSREALLPGGELLFLAECPDGIGPPRARENFYDPLTGPRAELLARRREDYVIYGHKPVKLARLLERCGALWMHTALAVEDLERIGVRPAPEPAEVLAAWLRRAPPGERVAFVDDASKLVVRRRSRGR